MTKACIIAVLISLLFTIQARAAHVCPDHGVPAVGDVALEMGVGLGSMAPHDESGHADDGGTDSHGAGHCDLCTHASFSAVGPSLPALIVTDDLRELIALSPSVSRVSPPLGRPDKPPR